MRALVVSQNIIDPVGNRLQALLRARLDDQAPVVVHADDVEKYLLAVQADMIIVVLTPDPERGLDNLRKVRRLANCRLLAAGHASEPRLILQALHEGAEHFLDEAELETGLDAALSRVQRKEETPAPAGRVVAVLAASGGSGASTLAVNLATILAKDYQKCALLDLKPGRGDLAALLDLKPAFNLADLCLNLNRLDRAMFEKLMVPHPCGVHLLGSPQMFGGIRVVTAHGVGQALGMARKLFPHVVVDLEDCFHEEQVLTLRQAAVVLLVIRLDFTSLRNARRTLDHLHEVDVPEARVRVVANRHGQPNELPVAEAEAALGVKIAHFVPEDAKTINGANNTGIPVVLKSPSARVSQSITQMARLILDRRRGETNGVKVMAF